MRSLIQGAPTGLPAIAVMWTGFLIFLIAFLSARRRAGTEERGNATRSRRSVVGIVVQGSGIGLAAAGLRAPSLDPMSAAALVPAVVAAILMAAAIWLFVWATRTMGRNWSLVARTRDDHRLVEDGPFAYLRHPIYTAMFLILIALAFALGHMARLWLCVPLFAIGTWLRIGEEERLLRTMFGAAYDGYAARVRRFVPGVC